MKLALIGLPQSGKTTIFNALTGSNRPLVMSSGRIEIHPATVNVPDERLENLAKLFSSKKTVYAQISFVDVAGIGAGESGQGLSSQLLNALTGMDGLLLVVRAFEDESVPHPSGTVEVPSALAAAQDELLLNDLIVVERKQQKLTEERGKGGRDIPSIEREIALFSRLQETLSANKPLRTVKFEKEEEAAMAGLGLLSVKPLLIVVNLSEGQSMPELKTKMSILGLQGKLEMELAQLSPEDAPAFLGEYGLQEIGAQRVIRAAYELLDAQTFYTVGEPEAHAWVLPRGGTAVEAAATVHSDIGRGFIRAEVIGAKELLDLGGMAPARDKGRLRLEGKDYVMQDGDVINVRFNV